jgi:succinate dehydrogenase/fumarate reductase flavoprotein subunit
MFREVNGERVAEWKEPFEAIPSQHFFMGGIRIDADCRTNIAGFCCRGNVRRYAWGKSPQWRRPDGSICNGAVAGKSAALYAKGERFVTPDSRVINEKIES